MRQVILTTVAVCLVALGQPAETPVSFDTPGSMLKLTPEVNRAAGVFPDLDDLDHVEIWRLDTTLRVEVYHRDGTRASRTIGPADLDSIRTKIDTYLSAQPARVRAGKPALEQEGRGRFLFEQLPIALGWYGPAALAIVEPEDLRVGAAVYLLSGAASYFIPLIYTADARVTNAQAHLSVALGYRGILAGFLLSDILQIHDESPRWNALFMLGTSIAGQFTGRAMADRLSLGQATLVTNYTDLGTLGGLLTGVIAERTLFRDSDNTTSLSVSTISGMAGGIIAGNARAQRWDCTEGRVIADRTGGLLGAAVVPAVYYAATGASLLHREPREPDWEILSALAIGGALAGTWWTENQLRDLPLSTSSGYIVSGTTIGGTLAGAGLGFVFNTASPEPRSIAATAAAGGVAGFLGGMKLAHSLQRAAGHTDRTRPRLELNGAAVAAVAASYSTRRDFSAPGLVTIRF